MRGDLGALEKAIRRLFAAMNCETIPEDITNHGQVDMTLKLGTHISVMEIKVASAVESSTEESTAGNSALRQIQEMGYAGNMPASTALTCSRWAWCLAGKCEWRGWKCRKAATWTWNARRTSDFDIGIRGLHAKEFMAVKAWIVDAVEECHIPHEVDVVDFDSAPEPLTKMR